MHVMVILEGQSNLFEVILAAGAACRFAGLLHSGQQQGHKDGDDCDNDKQFDECEAAAAADFRAAHG